MPQCTLCNSSLLKSINNGLISSLNVVGKPGLSLHVVLLFCLSA